MVRHHIKKKKSDIRANASKKQQEEKKRQEELENLDRFAGSSDEEDVSDGGDGDAHHVDGDTAGEDHELNSNDDRENSGSDESEDDYDDVYDKKTKDGASGRDTGHLLTRLNKPVVDSESGASSENDNKDDAQCEDGDDDEAVAPDPRDAKSLGMANAMSRILGGQQSMMASAAHDTAAPTTSKVAKPVILSKTTTPLQRLRHKMKSEEQALRQKRQKRRADNLSAMRLPLAPTAGMSADKIQKQRKKTTKRKATAEDGAAAEGGEFDVNALAMAMEIEGERTHRRIATRGVVALFNAISKHRATVAAEAVANEEEKRNAREEGRPKKKGGADCGVNTTTKHGFLEMIKKSAVAGGGGGSSIEQDARKENRAGGDGMDNSKANNKGKGSVGWSALKDDFMMNSKLKDWDKEISDDDYDG